MHCQRGLDILRGIQNAFFVTSSKVPDTERRLSLPTSYLRVQLRPTAERDPLTSTCGAGRFRFGLPGGDELSAEQPTVCAVRSTRRCDGWQDPSGQRTPPGHRCAPLQGGRGGSSGICHRLAEKALASFYSEIVLRAAPPDRASGHTCEVPSAHVPVNPHNNMLR